MAEDNTEIDKLMEKLELISERQKKLADAVNTLYAEIKSLKTGLSLVAEKPEIKPEPPVSLSSQKSHVEGVKEETQRNQHIATSPAKKSDWEKFIGENLLNKIGIAITVIGVGIGAKYSIDHNLISPMTRVLLGYLVGVGLLAFGIKLKMKYASFSAVLVSGALASMYFVTYLAYDVYSILPQLLAFVMMLIFTVFTTIAAISYSMQVIALIGLVGAYAVPFLLSDNSGRVHIFFSYVAIINAGILFLAFRQYWKKLLLASFILTWLIVISWYLSSYEVDLHFQTVLIFSSVFYLMFYATFLVYKLVRKEFFSKLDVALILCNSLIYFALGYAVLDGRVESASYLGLFTLANALIHFMAGAAIHRQKSADKNLFYLVVGLVLVCITIAVPVQLEGDWVTLLWSGEAALLFWIGRSKNVPMYEHMAYPLIFLSYFSLVHDWMSAYGNYYQGGTEWYIIPVLNIHFLTSLLFIAALGFIFKVQKRFPSGENPSGRKWLGNFINIAMPVMLISAMYFSVRVELVNYWQQLFEDSTLSITTDGVVNYYQNYSLMDFKRIWVANFSLLFFSVLAFINMRKVRNQTLALVNMILLVLALLSFVTDGLYGLASIRETYLSQYLGEYYNIGIWYLLLRYICYCFVIIALFALRKYVQAGIVNRNFTKGFDATLYITLIWLGSSELVHILALIDPDKTYDLGLSILWGAYSLAVIAIGIWKKKKHLRIGGILFFGITLLKLFIVDIAHLSTISKTIVFLSLGMLLLIVSFLYNKFKSIISDDIKE